MGNTRRHPWLLILFAGEQLPGVKMSLQMSLLHVKEKKKQEVLNVCDPIPERSWRQLCY